MQSVRNAWNIGAQYILTDWSINIDIEKSGKLQRVHKMYLL